MKLKSILLLMGAINLFLYIVYELINVLATHLSVLTEWLLYTIYTLLAVYLNFTAALVYENRKRLRKVHSNSLELLCWPWTMIRDCTSFMVLSTLNVLLCTVLLFLVIFTLPMQHPWWYRFLLGILSSGLLPMLLYSIVITQKVSRVFHTKLREFKEPLKPDQPITLTFTQEELALFRLSGVYILLLPVGWLLDPILLGLQKLFPHATWWTPLEHLLHPPSSVSKTSSR
jgi:hypothetical protein